MNKELQATMKEDARIATEGSEADFVNRVETLMEDAMTRELDVREQRRVIELLQTRIAQLLANRRMVLDLKARQNQ